MAKAEIFSGDCKMHTIVEATMEGKVCKLHITSDCEAIRKIAKELTEVSPYKEITFKRAMPKIHEAGQKYCYHASCPVPVGIIKAVEVEAKLALPTSLIIQVSKTDFEG
jgi:hypothetical protein